MAWDKCVLDVTLGGPPWCFVPLEGDPAGAHTLVLGMNYLQPKPPDGMRLVGVVHMDGQEALDDWSAAHPDVLAEFATADPT